MATQQKAAAPKKNSEGFQGVRGAFWIIVVCAAIAFTLFFTWFGAGMHFEGGVTSGAPLEVWGTQGWYRRACHPVSVAHGARYGYRASARSEDRFR